MNPADSTSMSSGYERSQSQHGYASSESESRQTSSSGKKRASRAGTRSVSTLSAAQLERKRANDREAQRAIRQRTKDHIEHLERNISELRAASEANEKMATATHQRNRELEEENAYLRTKLGEAGYAMNAPPSEGQRPPDQTAIPLHPTSPAIQPPGASLPRPDSTSTPRSALSVNTSQSSSSRHGSWQQGPSGFSMTAGGAAAGMSATAPVPLGPSLSTWRSHESGQSVHSSAGQLQDPTQTQPPGPYSPGNLHDRPQWTGAQQYPYHEQQRPQHLGDPPPPQPQQYTQPSMSSYPTGTTPQPSTYHAPPQAEFQSMTVHSPAGYPQNYGQPGQYQMAQMQVAPAQSNPAYPPQQPHMQPTSIPPPGYSNPSDPQYSQQQVQPQMQFREDPSQRGYSLNHFPSG
ncbi:hypothetical protein LTR37_020628 [Vermiconidia calcicola]|uniref:Uncharacterized protein n=1 Tax=Vermiconidia calcicola TaxID=1690605 RepID=A0ACC3MBY5_9PEZI|nr:hypothetical protein LTR37_020628 [Vermiconidia calcicola]